MINYKIVENNKEYHVLEKQTESIIRLFKKKKEAVEYCRFLNLGGAFDGFTPSFFLKKSEKNSNNKEVLV